MNTDQLRELNHTARRAGEDPTGDLGDLEQRCDECHGTGIRVGGALASSIACGACDGRGYHLTAAGRQLLVFLDRWVAL